MKGILRYSLLAPVIPLSPPMPTLKLKPGEYHRIDRGIFARGTRQGVVYGISYQHHGRRRLEVVGPTITLARKALAVRKAEIAQGKYHLHTTRRTPRFPEFATRYLEDYSKPNKRSWPRDEWVLRQMTAHFGPRRLDELTAFDVERYRAARLESGVSVATSNRDVALLKHLLSTAVRWGVLPTNPASEVKTRREEERPFRILTEAEERRLLAECADHLWPVVVAALNTGLRRGELLALDWSDVNLARMELTVRRSKSGRVRVVPMNADVLDVLRRIEPREGRVFRFEGRGIERVDRSFTSAVRRSGIRAVRFHDLRHTFISRLVERGVPLPVIQLLAGHATIATTMRYVHVHEGQKREAVRSLTSSRRTAPKSKPE